VRKALELDRRKRWLSREKGQTEKRENKRELSHDPFLLLDLIHGSQLPDRAATAPPALDVNQSPVSSWFQATFSRIDLTN
jgi:hypothetical protein